MLKTFSKKCGRCKNPMDCNSKNKRFCNSCSLNSHIFNSAKFHKSEIERYDWAIGYIKKELKTGRHILACLGSAGLTFNSDIKRFSLYTSLVGTAGAKELSEKIDKI